MARIQQMTVLLAVLVCPAAAQQAFAGDVTPLVQVIGQPDQPYALYLPRGYSHDRQWPVIFAFDPAGRGALPVNALKDLAEKYGYIIAGSNHARNGPIQPQIEAADAMIKDVTARFAVDRRRVYLTGFSGGARLALFIATLCRSCVAGVIAHGAGFPAQTSPAKDANFVYFLAIGDEDFNYAEVPPLRAQLEDAGVTHRIVVYPGPHQWAPKDIWEQALQWLDFQAIHKGSLPKDAAQVANTSAQWSAYASLLEHADPYLAWLEWRQMSLQFADLADTTTAKQRADALFQRPEVKNGAKRERQEVERQSRSAQDAMGLLAMLQREPSERAQAIQKGSAALKDLRKRAADARSPDSRAARRAAAQVGVYIFESAESAMRAQDYALADSLFSVLAGADPDAPMPHYHRARALAARGDAKRALEELNRAVKCGMKDRNLLLALEFDKLRTQPAFREVEGALAAPR